MVRNAFLSYLHYLRLRRILKRLHLYCGLWTLTIMEYHQIRQQRPLLRADPVTKTPAVNTANTRANMLRTVCMIVWSVCLYGLVTYVYPYTRNVCVPYLQASFNECTYNISICLYLYLPMYLWYWTQNTSSYLTIFISIVALSLGKSMFQ